MAITLGYVTIDCADPRTLGRFWSQALGWSITYEEDDGVLLAGTADACPQLFLQAVPESKTVKNRVHVDLGADDFAAELGRLVGLGASVFRGRYDALARYSSRASTGMWAIPSISMKRILRSRISANISPVAIPSRRAASVARRG